MDGNVQAYYVSQLQAEEQRDDDFQFLSCDQFHAYLTALQIRHPGLSTRDYAFDAVSPYM